MRKANKVDKKKFIEIIAEAFDTNPSVNWVIKNDKKRDTRIKALADYAFETSLIRNGAFISTDEMGIALCYKYNQEKNKFADYFNQAKLVFRAIGLIRVFKVLKREAYIDNLRPKSGDFLYFWFLGVKNEGKGKGAAKELKEYIFNLSNETALPIYLETSVRKNVNVYLRYGFEIYHTWEVEGRGIVIWLLKRN